jgi:hypothetical protein
MAGTQKYFIPRFHVDRPSTGQTTVKFGMVMGYVRYIIYEVLLVNKRLQTWRRSVSLIFTSDRFNARRMQNMYVNNRPTSRKKYNKILILLIGTVCVET